MADREKVIAHFNDAIEASGTNNKWRFVRVDVINDALELLKGQEPVKPKTHNGGGKSPTWWYVCGVCGHDIDPKDKFCRECGRKVKWDADREKVLQALKQHLIVNDGEECVDCPYGEVDGLEWVDCVRQLYQDAVELLKEQKEQLKEQLKEDDA